MVAIVSEGTGAIAEAIDEYEERCPHYLIRTSKKIIDIDSQRDAAYERRAVSPGRHDQGRPPATKGLQRNGGMNLEGNCLHDRRGCPVVETDEVARMDSMSG